MGMQFTISASAQVELRDMDAGDIDIDADDIFQAEFGYTNASFVNARVTGGTVTIEANVSQSDIEVEASNLSEFDAESYFENELSSYSATFTGGEFFIDEYPSGFAAVEDVIGRESAIEVYAALANGGYEVL